jgi:hypothetical protein
MARKNDWIPSGYEALTDLGERVYNYIGKEPQRTRMGFATGTAQGDWFDNVFVPALGVLRAAYDAWELPQTRTRLNVAAMRQAIKDFVPVFRRLYTGFLKNSPLATNADLDNMTLPRRVSGRTPAARPSSYPIGRVDLSKPWTVIIHIHDSDNERSMAKPARVHGVQIRWQVFDTQREVGFEDLREADYVTRNPFEISFREEQRGKFFYYVMRWSNTVAEKGSYGRIDNAVIP